MIMTNSFGEKFILENNNPILKKALNKIIQEEITSDIFYKELEHAPLHKSIVILADVGELIYNLSLKKDNSIHFEDEELFELRKLSDELFNLMDEENIEDRTVFFRKPSTQELLDASNNVIESHMQRQTLEADDVFDDTYIDLGLDDDFEEDIQKD